MDSLFHFIFPVLAALAAKVHDKHEIRDIIIAGALAVLIDIDHYVGLVRATFHNIFITLLLPIIFVSIAFSFNKKYNFKGFSILLLIFLSSHLFLDFFSEGFVALFYPISQEYYSFSFNILVPIGSQFSSSGQIISTEGIGILIYFVIIFLPCMFLDDIIEIMERKHESFRKVLKDLSHPKK
jgi:membrane-bound metal-dependent hydrolase YbcI (DUF457 family)